MRAGGCRRGARGPTGARQQLQQRDGDPPGGVQRLAGRAEGERLRQPGQHPHRLGRRRRAAARCRRRSAAARRPRTAAPSCRGRRAPARRAGPASGAWNGWRRRSARSPSTARGDRPRAAPAARGGGDPAAGAGPRAARRRRSAVDQPRRSGRPSACRAASTRQPGVERVRGACAATASARRRAETAPVLGVDQPVAGHRRAGRRSTPMASSSARRDQARGGAARRRRPGRRPARPARPPGAAAAPRRRSGGGPTSSTVSPPTTRRRPGSRSTARSPIRSGSGRARRSRTVSAPSGRTRTGTAAEPMCRVSCSARQRPAPPDRRRAGRPARRRAASGRGEQHVAARDVVARHAPQVHRDPGDRATRSRGSPSALQRRGPAPAAVAAQLQLVADAQRARGSVPVTTVPRRGS